MNKNNENNNLNETDAKNAQTDKSSVCDRDQRMLWFIASEVAGHGDFPTSPRWTREHLAKLAEGKEHLKRRRKGTKATEYHISLLSPKTQNSLGYEPIDIKDEKVKPPAFPIDRELLQSAIEAVELLCEKKRLRMSAEKKAKVIALIYTISLEEKSVDESVIYQILDLAS